jgi:hypothetical protein
MLIDGLSGLNSFEEMESIVSFFVNATPKITALRHTYSTVTALPRSPKKMMFLAPILLAIVSPVL